MPRINHNVGHANSNNNQQQTNLLTRIEENTKNINVNVGDVEINVQDVEDLITITNTKLQTDLDFSGTPIDIVDSTTMKRTMNYGYDQPNGQQRPLLVDDSGMLKVVVASGAGSATEEKQDTAIGHLATVAGAVTGTEMQVDVVTMPTVAVTLSGGATEAK